MKFIALVMFAAGVLAACGAGSQGTAGGGTISDVSVNDASAAISKGGVQFIDVRTPAEYSGGHARGAKNLPLDKLSNELSSLDPAKPVYVICQTGSRSKRASQILKDSGFQSIYNITGGTTAWKEAKLETE